MDPVLIIDLDDTIYNTRSIDPGIFDPAIALVHKYCSASELLDADEIISVLWTQPIDKVFVKYNLPENLKKEFYDLVATIDYHKLEIEPFADYMFLNSIGYNKILVTTGIRELQLAKIKALKIDSDFDALHIDDPRTDPRINKFDIFSELLVNTKRRASEFWVIGDNPDSEIKAGRILGMNTIQRRSLSKGDYEKADYQIDTFKELRFIIPGLD